MDVARTVDPPPSREARERAFGLGIACTQRGAAKGRSRPLGGAVVRAEKAPPSLGDKPPAGPCIRLMPVAEALDELAAEAGEGLGAVTARESHAAGWPRTDRGGACVAPVLVPPPGIVSLLSVKPGVAGPGSWRSREEVPCCRLSKAGATVQVPVPAAEAKPAAAAATAAAAAAAAADAATLGEWLTPCL